MSEVKISVLKNAMVNGHTYTAVKPEEPVILENVHKSAQHALGGPRSTRL